MDMQGPLHWQSKSRVRWCAVLCQTNKPVCQVLQEIEVDTAASIDHKRKLAIAAQQSWAQQTFAARVKVIKAFQATLAGLVQHERGTANMIAQHAPLLACAADNAKSLANLLINEVGTPRKIAEYGNC